MPYIRLKTNEDQKLKRPLVPAKTLGGEQERAARISLKGKMYW